MKLIGCRLVPLAVALLTCSVAAWGIPSGGVPQKLMSKLTIGVNITRWFCYLANPADTSHFTSYMTPADFAALKRLHVGFVRLCISPEAIYDDGQVNSSTLPYLDAAIRRLETAGMAVIVDLHDNGQMQLQVPGHDNDGFVSFWQAMARHFKNEEEGQTIFELVNEPQFYNNPKDWQLLQEKTVATVRAIDRKRTIMVTSTRWSSIDTLAQMKPLPEKNLSYTFHCYDPFFFTHQGANWVGDAPKLFKSVPFPSSPDAVSAMIDQIPDPFKSDLNWYGSQRFDAAYIKSRIEKAVAWGDKNRVPVLLGEFGSYPLVAPKKSREHWFAAMRAAVNAFHVPYSVWGYDDAMGLGRRIEPDGKLWLDPVTLRYLYGVSASAIR